jgi:hypothetical protein
MMAVRVPITGPVEVIDIVEPSDNDSQAFLTELYSVIGTDSVECVRLTEVLDAWLDETETIHGKPLNRLATHLARTFGFDEPLHGNVVILAVDHDTGQSVGLTDKQVSVITRVAKTSPRPGTGTVRDDVAKLAALGRLPSEGFSEDQDQLFQAMEQHLSAITRPVSIDEARLLAQLFPTTEDSSFGTAWTLLHLIESCPDWPGDDDLGNGPWPDTLRQRLRNGLNN